MMHLLQIDRVAYELLQGLFCQGFLRARRGVLIDLTGCFWFSMIFLLWACLSCPGFNRGLLEVQVLLHGSLLIDLRSLVGCHQIVIIQPVLSNHKLPLLCLGVQLLATCDIGCSSLWHGKYKREVTWSIHCMKCLKLAYIEMCFHQCNSFQQLLWL